LHVKPIVMFQSIDVANLYIITDMYIAFKNFGMYTSGYIW